jgi:hypothetical protein
LVQVYYEALLRRDWPTAYAALDADSQAWCNLALFSQLAEQYVRNLGMESPEVHLRSCEEHGDQGVAHVTIMGQGHNKQGLYKDGLTLRRGTQGWRIVLSPKFGRSKNT